MSNSSKTYSRVQSLLHWAIAAMVIFQVLVNSDIGRAYHAVHNNTTPSVSTALWANIHIWIGLAILVFATWLVTLRWTRGVPPAPANEKRFLSLVALGTKIALYGLVFASPLTGAAAWFLDVRTLGLLHSVAQTPAFLLISLHFCGAIYQHFFLKSDVLRRILPIRQIVSACHIWATIGTYPQDVRRNHNISVPKRKYWASSFPCGGK